VPDWLLWQSHSGQWLCTLPLDDPRRPMFDLYLPLCGASADRPLTIAHVGQSLDGYIATAAGDSFYVNGPDNILHLHRLRALCDAVVVGAGTVAADNPRLTVRLTSGTHPLRVIIDPARRLGDDAHVFNDGLAPTLRVVSSPQAAAGAVPELVVAQTADGLDLVDLLRQLHLRGCRRVFIEGGGITVSAFLRAGLLDRLHIAIAPLLIGEGRRALRLPAQDRLQDCLRLSVRVFAMGTDTLYDCTLRESALPGSANTSS
jgi:riboflavin-specific deaminase-like protein